ncbi:MAG: GNAT family N-acetyltransferase [Sandaracinus sp.]
MRGIALLVALACLWPGSAAAQPARESFDYRVTRRVTGTGGSYVGWSDSLTAEGHYEVSGAGTGTSIHGRYAWRYVSPDSTDSGAEDRTVEVDPERIYVTRTDLDEYDDDTRRTLATWTFVPTTLAVGDHVSILGDAFEVTGVDVPVMAAGASRPSIALVATGEGRRDDAYGHFTTTFRDEYWFDRATGMFLREVRSEDDDGTSDGQRAAMRVSEVVEITDASYAHRVGPPLAPETSWAASARDDAAGSGMGFGGALLGGGAALLGLLLWLAMRRTRPQASPIRIGGEEVIVARLAPPATLNATDVSLRFGMHLPHFIAVAHRMGEAVWVAHAGDRVVGVAIDDSAGGVPTIFAKDGDVCELLRKQLARTDFFCEMQHGVLDSVRTAAQLTGAPLTGNKAYNLVETYQVLRLEPVPSPPFDPEAVTRLEPHDAAEAGALATRVLAVAAQKFVEAALAEGDLGYVARVDGKIVGLGLASLVGSEGRLHTLVVDPAHRNRGLGRELARARIRALAALGATHVITEISTLATGSLEIARGEGFRKIGDMYVETARTEPAPARAAPTVRL